MLVNKEIMMDLNDLSDGISVIIPTFQRSRELENAILSVFSQVGIQQFVEIIVVDNNKTRQEEARVAALAKKSPFPITYVHVEKAGLSNARNAAMNYVQSDFIAFLDDDMIASPDWLSEIIKTTQKFEAGIVFAPAFAVMPNPADSRNRYMKPYFSRLAENNEEGIMDETLGMGGCLLNLKYCDLPSPVFDPSLNHKGGEDDILFDYLRQNGTKVAWSPAAKTYEIVPQNRATTKYIKARNFGYGQGPTRICASRGLSGVPGILYYMLTGLIQAAIYGPVFCFLSLTGQAAYIKYLALTSRAFGKVFWGNKFSTELYGNHIEKPETSI